jgi:hypothetical protein
LDTFCVVNAFGDTDTVAFEVWGMSDATKSISFRSLKSSVTALGNTFVYVVALSAVDLLVTVSIPFSLSASLLNNWVFGEIGCKIHWAVELSNKVLQSLFFDSTPHSPNHNNEIQFQFSDVLHLPPHRTCIRPLYGNLSS